MVISGNPLLKSASGRSVLAEMPFAQVCGAIILVLHQFRKNEKPLIEWHAIAGAAVDVRPRACHQ